MDTAAVNSYEEYKNLLAKYNIEVDRKKKRLAMKKVALESQVEELLKKIKEVNDKIEFITCDLALKGSFIQQGIKVLEENYKLPAPRKLKGNRIVNS
jgi:hypothetical protein